MTILHTNDLHAHDESFRERGNLIGGLARIGHLIGTIRKNTPNVLAIDAGDIFQGTPYFKFYHGAVEVGLLNLAGYDIYTPGNHEFDDGSDNLAKQLQAAKFDVISANIDASGVPDLAKIIKPSVIKTVGGKKVGFVGAITPDLEQISLTTGLVHIKDKDADWLKPIRQEVEKLKAEGITRIILVTHVGLERDKELAEAIPDIDVIVGGHSHTRLEQPVVVKHPDGSQTIIVQTGCYGRALGKLKLAFDAQGRLIPADLDYHLINIADHIYEDKNMAAFIAERAGPVQALRRKKVAVALDDFDNRFNQYSWDSPIGDLICDALVEAGTKYGATISFENRGGIRGRLERGPITMEKVEEILPFENHLTFATISGKILLKALEHSVGGGLGGPFFDVHGLKLAYDPTKPSGSRVVFAMAQDARGRWHDIDPEAKYKIAINDYSFNAGEGYDFNGATEQEATKSRLSTVVAEYLTKKKVVQPLRSSRIIPVTDRLVSVVKHGNKRFLHVQSGMPRARLTLVTGSWPGVEPVGQAPPVPLTNPHVLDSRAIADDAGEYSWELPIKVDTSKSSSRRRLSKPLETSTDKWAAVIVHPPKSTDGRKIKISYPVPLSPEYQNTRRQGYSATAH